MNETRTAQPSVLLGAFCDKSLGKIRRHVACTARLGNP